MESVAKDIVYLVHGTWGRGLMSIFAKAEAPWCASGSALRRMIDATLTGRVEFRVLNWSGDNSTGARRNATASLRKALAETIQAEPHARIHLVTHSHGANVALYALKAADVSSRIASLVCLSAPFLHVQPRFLGARLARQFEYLMRAAVAIFAAGVAIFILATASLTMSCLVSLGVIMIAWWAVPPALRRVHAAAHSLANELALPTELPFPVLIVRRAGDEATSALGGPQLVSGLVSRLLFLLMLPFKFYDQNVLLSRGLSGCAPMGSSSLVALAGLSALASAITLVVRHPALVLQILAEPIAVLELLLLFLLIPVILALVITPLLVLLSVAMMPFGFELAASGLSLQIAGEATPPGLWPLLVLPAAGRIAAVATPLQHSTHSDPEILECVRTWLTRALSATAPINSARESSDGVRE